MKIRILYINCVSDPLFHGGSNLFTRVWPSLLSANVFFLLKNLSIVVPTGVKSLFYTLLYLGQVQPIPLMFSSIDGHGWCSVRLVATDDVRFDWWPQMMISSTGDHRWCSVRQVTTDDVDFDRWPRMMLRSTGGHGWCSVPPVATDDVQFIVIVNR